MLVNAYSFIDNYNSSGIKKIGKIWINPKYISSICRAKLINTWFVYIGNDSNNFVIVKTQTRNKLINRLQEIEDKNILRMIPDLVIPNG